MASLPDLPDDIGAPEGLAPPELIDGFAEWLRGLPFLGALLKPFIGGTLSTEQASTVFALVGSVGAALANLAAGERLTQYPRENINARRLLVPILFASVTAFFAGAVLMPDDTGPVFSTGLEGL